MEKINTNAYSKSTFTLLYWTYKPFLKRIYLLFTVGLIGRACLLGNTNLIGYWVDSLCKAPSVCKAGPKIFHNWEHRDYLFALMVMALVGFICLLLFRTFFSRTSAQAISRMYDEATWRVSRAPLHFFDSQPVGRIVTRFASDYGNVFRFFGGPLAEFISLLIDLILIVALLTLASPFYLLAFAILAIFYGVVFQRHRLKLRELRRDLSARRSPSIAHFSETAQGVVSIRSQLKEKSFLNRFLHLDKIYQDQKIKTQKGFFHFSFEMSFISSLLLFFVGGLSYFLVQKNWVSVGSVGVAFTLITMSSNTVQMFFEWLTQIEESLIGVERIDKYVRTPIESGVQLPAKAQFMIDPASDTRWTKPLVPWSNKKSISVELKNISFRYGEDLPWVLQDLSIHIAAGEKIGIIGRTGCGKSSLIQILFQLYPFQKGELLFDGKPAPDLEETRKNLSFLSQDPNLFTGTLRSNLDLCENFADLEIWNALEKIGLKEWVEAQPDALLMPIQERGRNLSMGERQLICLARLLLQDSPLLLMDEATSSVDPTSEKILMDGLEKYFQGRTQIIVAHRLTTLRNCDRILWLDHGKVFREGNYQTITEEVRSGHKEFI